MQLFEVAARAEPLYRLNATGAAKTPRTNRRLALSLSIGS